MLDLSQDKTHTTDSHHTTESDFLKNLCLKASVALGNSVHERWTQLDDKVSDKLHMCATLAETLTLLQESIYNDAAGIFEHLQPKKRNLAGESQPSCPLNLSNKRIFFWLKLIQLLCLTQLLINDQY